MKLEQFNRHGKFIEFDPGQGLAKELDGPDVRPIRGVGDWRDASFVALVAADGELRIYVNEKVFVVRNGCPEIRYVHNPNATTTCVVRDETQSVEVTYRSWWVLSPADIPALADSDDEAEDFFAYLILMLQTKERMAHLVRKYS